MSRSRDSNAARSRSLLGVERIGFPPTTNTARICCPVSGSGVSISSARAETGNSPNTLGRFRTRVRLRPGMLTPWPVPGVPSVDGPPATARGNITPPGLSSDPIPILMTSMSQEPTVAMGITESPQNNPEVVVPMRPYTAAVGAEMRASAISRVTVGSTPVMSAIDSGVKGSNWSMSAVSCPGLIHCSAAPRSRLSDWKITLARAASHSASLPGRIVRCRSANSAVRVRIGSTTTTLPPRLRSARSRPGKSAAVIMDPLETSGLAPSIKK